MDCLYDYRAQNSKDFYPPPSQSKGYCCDQHHLSVHLIIWCWLYLWQQTVNLFSWVWFYHYSLVWHAQGNNIKIFIDWTSDPMTYEVCLTWIFYAWHWYYICYIQAIYFIIFTYLKSWMQMLLPAFDHKFSITIFIIKINSMNEECSRFRRVFQMCSIYQSLTCFWKLQIQNYFYISQRSNGARSLSGTVMMIKLGFFQVSSSSKIYCLQKRHTLFVYQMI